jgi:hypothetical protein
MMAQKYEYKRVFEDGTEGPWTLFDPENFYPVGQVSVKFREEAEPPLKPGVYVRYGKSAAIGPVYLKYRHFGGEMIWYALTDGSNRATDFNDDDARDGGYVRMEVTQ